MIHDKNTFTINIASDAFNQRIDNFIRKRFKKIKNNKLYQMLRIGCIKINNKKIKPYYKIKPGDQLKYYESMELKQKNNSIFLNEKTKKKFYSYILFEDEDLLIINKPPGIAVHGGSGLKFGIIEIFRFLQKKNQFLELIHRIDRNTSGILMLAKKRNVLKNMHQQFRENKIFKSYTAIVHGTMKINKQYVSIPLIKKKSICGKKIIVTDRSGKESTSIFKIKKRINNNTIVEIIPKTGRTHQIRVHAAYLGFPIIFDNIYGNIELDNNFPIEKKYKKILLHASKIIFYHPKYFKKYYIYAPLENRFITFLKNI